MSTLECFILSLAIVIKVQQANADCSTSHNFVPFGATVGDSSIASKDIDATEYDYSNVPFTFLGLSAPESQLILYNHGLLRLYPRQASGTPAGLEMQPMYLDFNNQPELMVGDVYNRHSTDPADLSIVNSMACGPFDSVVIITYASVGVTASSSMLSVQVLVASGPTKSVVIFNYSNKTAEVTDRYIRNLGTGEKFPLDEVDITDDGITIMDITNPPTLSYRTRIHVETGGPCQECITPDNFFPYGLDVGDAKVASRDAYGNEFDYPIPFHIFGVFGNETRLTFYTHGQLLLEPLPEISVGIEIQPRLLEVEDRHQTLIVGNIYNRHSTNSCDLSIVNSMACGPFDSVVIITYACVGMTACSQILSYQLLFASGPTKSVFIFNYANKTAEITERFIGNYDTGYEFQFNETDIEDDGITIVDVTNDTNLSYGVVYPVETGGPCPAASRTCSVYRDGTVKMLNGTTVSDELTLEQSFVATVDKAERKKNSDPCKFFLMIRTNDAAEPIYYVRIGVAVHPRNKRKYLRKFQFSLTNDSFVKEFGYSLSADKFLTQTDMPYTMDDTGSAEQLGITVDVTDCNDGWVIKSATCGYTFTHLWNNQDPIVTMTLEGDRYDGHIQETCAGM